ncbi:MAG: response regulator [Planctomycetales bacterium]|nr:response regulator [Planctomycetales bacterium]
MNRILIVDDNLQVGQGIAALLATREIDAEVAKDVPHARELMRRSEFNLALVDLLLDGDSGEALVRELRAESIPAILMSGLGMESFDGDIPFLIKPFTREQLATACLKLLEVMGQLESDSRGNNHEEFIARLHKLLDS